MNIQKYTKVKWMNTLRNARSMSFMHSKKCLDIYVKRINRTNPVGWLGCWNGKEIRSVHGVVKG